MPCCFKKDLDSTNNKKKIDFYKKCVGQKIEDKKDQLTKTQEQQNLLDKLYILQDTNKIQIGRMGFLPKYLDLFLNIMLEKDRIIKQNYLSLSKKGYLFKYGVDQDTEPFMSAISVLLDLSIIEIKEKIISALQNDKNDLIFSSLNSGVIKNQFETKDNYIEFIKYNELEFEIINNILSIPGVITDGGLNLVIFYKQSVIIKQTLEKEKTKDDFYILCQNTEDKYSITDTKKDTIFLLKENKSYFPIVMVIKLDKNNKNFDLIKKFRYIATQEDNLVKHILDFYYRNCHSTFLNDMLYKNKSLNAHDTLHVLENLKIKDYLPKYQVLDVRNKCKYFVTNNNYLIPVRISGSIYNIQIVKSADKYYHNFEDTYNFLNNLYKKSNEQLKVKPYSVYYDSKDKNKYSISAITIIGGDIIPIISENIDKSKIEKEKLLLENKPLYDKLDKEILKGKNNYTIDKRITEVNYDRYLDESYELFRLELSNYLNKNQEIREKILNIIDKDKKHDNKTKLIKIKLLLYKLIDNDLYKKYKAISEISDDIVLSQDYEINNSQSETSSETTEDTNNIEESSETTENTNNIEESSETTEELSASDESTIVEQTGGNINKKMLHVINKIPDLTKYKVSNEREICDINVNKDKCNMNPHCTYYHNNCYFSITKKMIIVFINKVSQELIEYDLKAFEILKISDYFVSDIVDYNTYKEKPGQKIVKSNSSTIKKVLNELFGKNNAPRIGRRKTKKILDLDYQQLNEENPPKYMGKYILQEIPNNMSLFRAFVNCYYWLKNSYYDDTTRNLGYYNPVQTDFANYFKSLVIDWLQEPSNEDEIKNTLYVYMEIKKKSKDYINDFIIKLSNDIHILSNCLVELYILNKIEKIPILIMDNDDILIYVINDGIKYNYYKNNNINKEVEKILEKKNKCISLRFTFITNKTIPDDIDSIYYK